MQHCIERDAAGEVVLSPPTRLARGVRIEVIKSQPNWASGYVFKTWFSEEPAGEAPPKRPVLSQVSDRNRFR